MPKLTIDGKELTVNEGITILQACEISGVEIPRFCYHEKLSIAGNCRMCLVEMENSPKPIASCAMPASEGMVIYTNTSKVQKAREGVMEFLLINHPLDCPICDQGGECDLQDQAISYGRDKNRFYENKRSVEDKEIGPLIKTTMTRCIHCTRCVRFAQDIAGVSDLGATGRGEDMEIDTYVQKSITSELSGNIIDLCPVGALTSKPYAFEARSWELRKTESIDALDALGCNIRIDTRGREVKRILPRLNEVVNEEWISDKTRFSYDGLNHSRLDRPWAKNSSGVLTETTWENVFEIVKEKFSNTQSDKISAIVGDLVDCESIFALKQLLTEIGSPNFDCRQDGVKLEAKSRSEYIFNSEIVGIDKADYILLLGADPRWEAPVLNARIRRKYISSELKVSVLGQLPNRENGLTYPFNDIGADPTILNDILNSKHEISKDLNSSKNPMIIIGQTLLQREDGSAILSIVREICNKFNIVRDDWNGYNVLHNAAARVGGLDLGFVPPSGGQDVKGILEKSKNGDMDIVYLLGADEIDISYLDNTFVIYQGHHGDKGAEVADVIFPGAAYCEKDSTYVNTEGRVQRTKRATFPPNEARDDWAIIRALSEVLGYSLRYNNLNELRLKMEEEYPVFKSIDNIITSEWGEFGLAGSISNELLPVPVNDFYSTNVISRASETMNLCKKTFLLQSNSNILSEENNNV
ncbi:NADH-quinone oxidoreductase subunit NuoG [Alphaproteobacteria bacterium]|nr:NADH-quinone oxidoreductase subunit NuoG [Alphaproteobacteria bacterium]